MTAQAENQDKTGIRADSGAQAGNTPDNPIRKTVLMPEAFFTAVEDYRWSARMNFSEAIVALAEVGLAVQRGEFVPKA
jgi:hypothetical protein